MKHFLVLRLLDNLPRATLWQGEPAYVKTALALQLRKSLLPHSPSTASGPPPSRREAKSSEGLERVIPLAPLALRTFEVPKSGGEVAFSRGAFTPLTLAPHKLAPIKSTTKENFLGGARVFSAKAAEERQVLFSYQRSWVISTSKISRWPRDMASKETRLPSWFQRTCRSHLASLVPPGRLTSGESAYGE